MNLTPVQQQIVDTPGNLIVRASAGTGKTHTMVAKIATEIEHNHTHKSIGFAAVFALTGAGCAGCGHSAAAKSARRPTAASCRD